MKVWLSTIGQRLDHADDTRTMLLARYLMEAGHSVVLWTSAWDHIRKCWREEWLGSRGAPYVMPTGLEVRFMKGCGYAGNVGPRRLVDHVLAARDFRRQAATLPPPDIAVASLPDHITAAAMMAYAAERGIARMIDVRDKWPDIFFDYAPGPAKPIVRAGLLFESRRARTALRRADALVAMMHSMLDWGLAKAGRPATADDRVFYLSTMAAATPDSDPLDALTDDHRAILAQCAGKTVFTFVGTFNRTQHPLLAIRAFEALASRPDFPVDKVALLVGGAGIEGDEVERRIAALPFAHSLGWLKPPEMRAILVRSDAGLLPLNFPSPAFNNKAFAYLAAGIPIVNCAEGDLADLIDAEDVGINVRGGDVDGFADAIAQLVADPARLAEMQAATRRLYAASFDQAATYRAYVAHVETIAARRSGPQAG
jgi:glycosyltransferase involved in cell wall biosynthesis